MDNHYDEYKYNKVKYVRGKPLFFAEDLTNKSNKYKHISEMPKTIEDARVLDLFCGAGGFSYGMHKNKNFETVVAVDFNSAATETFKKNMTNACVITGDITDVNVKKEVIELEPLKDSDEIEVEALIPNLSFKDEKTYDCSLCGTHCHCRPFFGERERGWLCGNATSLRK